MNVTYCEGRIAQLTCNQNGLIDIEQGSVIYGMPADNTCAENPGLTTPVMTGDDHSLCMADSTAAEGVVRAM